MRSTGLNALFVMVMTIPLVATLVVVTWFVPLVSPDAPSPPHPNASNIKNGVNRRMACALRAAHPGCAPCTDTDARRGGKCPPREGKGSLDRAHGQAGVP